MSNKDTRKNRDGGETGQRDSVQNPENLATGGPPADETGPELDSAGSDQESNVAGRSKPASDGVEQQQRDEHQSKGKS